MGHWCFFHPTYRRWKKTPCVTGFWEPPCRCIFLFQDFWFMSCRGLFRVKLAPIDSHSNSVSPTWRMGSQDLVQWLIGPWWSFSSTKDRVVGPLPNGLKGWYMGVTNYLRIFQHTPGTYPRPPQEFMKGFLSFGGLGIHGVCSRGMLGFS